MPQNKLTFTPVKRYPASFWLACISMLLFMISFNLIIPELNDFITRLGGADLKGLVFAFFTLSSAFARPFAGRLADYVGRKWVMYFGISLGVILTLFYPLAHSLAFFLALRFLHGISVGFTPTGATALVTDLLPSDNRGTAMGVWGTFISLGIGIGQIGCSPLVALVGLKGLFIISSGIAALSSILLFRVQESLKKPERVNWRHLILKFNDVFEPPVLPAAMVMYLSAFTSGVIFVISPDFSKFLGIDNKGWFFLFYVIATIFIRLFTGKLSDILGRRQTLLIGMSLLISSMIWLAFARTPFHFTFASILFGLATGVSSPTLFAWTADLSHPDRRGVGSGTMFIAMEFGILSGSGSTMLFYHNTLASVTWTFMAAAFSAFIALLYLLWHLRYRQSHT